MISAYLGKRMKKNIVTVKEYGGTIAEKVLVEDRVDVLIVTTQEEWEKAQREGREPIVVGFRREYVVERGVKMSRGA
jgi:hypothetical protein